MKKTIITLFAIHFMVIAWAQENPAMQLVQEGVKWVNEKVIINQGDTTIYYYTYEIQGDDTEWHWEYSGNEKLCHYYTGESIDYSNDSIISSLEQNVVGGTVNSYNNQAFDKVVQEGRNIMPNVFFPGVDDGNILYPFWHDHPEYMIATHFYLVNQVLPILTEENFTMIEPIEIDGYICNRYAYVKENGDTMCYVVEGIGFDSRNMGDLLTPFTREPDPDADYQEYCGLSHVIKDGKIIYKGMRYNPALFDIPGDVNGDGEITIADANSVIDIVVMGGNAGHTRAPAADVNDDGEINIADVNAIINIILDGK